MFHSFNYLYKNIFLYTVYGWSEELCLIILSSVVAFFNYKIFPFRCFAESSLNMETYDAVVEYEQLG